MYKRQKENRARIYNSRKNRIQTVAMVWSCNEDGGEGVAKESIDLHTTKQKKKRKTDNTMAVSYTHLDVYKRQVGKWP